MLYEFSLDKKAVGLLVAASALLVLLVFILGLVIGVHWYAPTETTTTATTATKTNKRQPVFASEAEGPTLPQEAAIEGEALRPEAGAATEAAATAKADSLLTPAGAAQEGTPKAGALPGADPQVIQRAKPDAVEGAAADEGTALKREAFSVQVGVFLEEIDANRLVEEMESKGYTPSILVANDADDRPWYSVRIGAYADQAEATQAASNFTKQEKKKAVVRPINSL